MSKEKQRRLEPLRLPGLTRPPGADLPQNAVAAVDEPPRTILMPAHWDPVAQHDARTDSPPRTEPGQPADFVFTPQPMVAFIPPAPKRGPRSKGVWPLMGILGIATLIGATCYAFARFTTDPSARSPAATPAASPGISPVTTTVVPTSLAASVEPVSTRPGVRLAPRANGGALWHTTFRAEVGTSVHVMVTGDGENDLDCWIKGPSNRAAEDLTRSKHCSMQFLSSETGTHELTVGNWGTTPTSFTVKGLPPGEGIVRDSPF